jgi:hypothetical protein
MHMYTCLLTYMHPHTEHARSPPTSLLLAPQHSLLVTYGRYKEMLFLDKHE